MNISIRRIPGPALAQGDTKALTHHVAQEGVPAISFGPAVLPVSPKSCERWARARVKVKVSESGGGTLHCSSTQRAEVERGTGWQSWPRHHHQGPDSAGRVWPRPNCIWPGDPGGPPLEERGMKSKHIWPEAEPKAYTSLILYRLPFSPTMKLMRAFHCVHALLLRSTFPRICLSHWIVSFRGWVAGLSIFSCTLSEGLAHPACPARKGYWSSKESPLRPCGLGVFRWKVTCTFQDCPCIQSQVHLILFSVPPHPNREQNLESFWSWDT